MNKELIIKNTVDFVKMKLSDDSSGHDWWHIYRVWQLAKTLYKTEQGDLFVIELAALLHDIADWKFHETEEAGLDEVRKWLNSQNVESTVSKKVIEIIANVSFKGAGVKDKMISIEGKIVQDADRLDAIGAIGVARTFAFGGKFGNQMHNPNEKHQMHNSFSEYKKLKGTTVNHFYEKLFLLKDRMNTKSAKKIASERHQFMELFLNQFYDEWDGIK